MHSLPLRHSRQWPRDRTFIVKPFARPTRVGFFASFASFASPPFQAMSYGATFRMICVYLCVTAVSPEFRDGAGDLAKAKSRAIVQFGRKPFVGRVFAACLRLVSLKRRCVSSECGDRAGDAARRASRAIVQFGIRRVVVRVFAACRWLCFAEAVIGQS